MSFKELKMESREITPNSILKAFVLRTFSTSLKSEQSKIQTHIRFKRTLFIRTKTQSESFGGNPLYQPTKRHFLNGEKY